MRVAVMFGQFGQVADPINLPHFRQRVADRGIETILVQHTDSQKVHDFLSGYKLPCGLVGASLGAGAVVLMASYLRYMPIAFVGGFQPSDWDPVMHDVSIPAGEDTITRAITVPPNVREALCFRNPIKAATGGLGHAAYVLDPTNHSTKLQIIERPDVHPGDFGEAQDIMFNRLVQALEGPPK